MKNGILFALSLLLFYSCESESGVDYPAYYKQQLLDEYEAFQKEPIVAQHLALIDELKERSIADSQKDVFVDNRVGNMAVSQKDTSLFYFVSADQEVTKNFMNFQHEVKLENVRHTIENPFESLPSEFNATTTGVMRFKQMTQDMLKEIRRNQFIVIFRTISKSMPASIGGEFIPGVYRGRILMYFSNSKELVANMDVVATSSNSVTVVGSSANQGLATDFADQINEAYLATLRTKFLAAYVPELSNRF